MLYIYEVDELKTILYNKQASLKKAYKETPVTGGIFVGLSTMGLLKEIEDIQNKIHRINASGASRIMLDGDEVDYLIGG